MVSPELFQFDKHKKPKDVAGCPPDDFAVTGQLWGNPLYDWEYHKKPVINGGSTDFNSQRPFTI